MTAIGFVVAQTIIWARVMLNTIRGCRPLFIIVWIILLAPPKLLMASDSATLPIGVWQARGYGFVFDVGPKQVVLYDTLGPQCFWHRDMSPATFAGVFGDWNFGETSVMPGPSWHLIVSGMTVTQLSVLPKACAQASRIRDNDPLRNFDVLWGTFQTHYAFFKQHGVDWDVVREKYRPQVAALSKDGDPFPIFAEIVKLLKDTHVHLSDGKRNAHVRKFADVVEQRPNGPLLLDDHYLQSQLTKYLTGSNTPLAAAANSAGNGRVWYGRLQSHHSTSDHPIEYGYMAIFAMDGFGNGQDDNTPLDVRIESAEQAMHEVISSFRGVRGVVVDLRYNGGGEESISLAIASHFTDTTLPVWSKHPYEKDLFHGAYKMNLEPSTNDRLIVPLVVLTSDFTVSAAETATMALRAIPKTIQIGQPTRGVLSDKLEKVLPNGWEFSLSNEIYADTSGDVFEVRGVPPDIMTPFPLLKSPDIERFGRDIQAAIVTLDKAGQ